MQVIPQTPPVHAALPFAPSLHTVPQAPQFATLASVLVSQPLSRLLSQLAKFSKQVIPQVPDVQIGMPLVGLHTVAQVPQCVGAV